MLNLVHAAAIAVSSTMLIEALLARLRDRERMVVVNIFFLTCLKRALQLIPLRSTLYNACYGVASPVP